MTKTSSSIDPSENICKPNNVKIPGSQNLQRLPMSDRGET